MHTKKERIQKDIEVLATYTSSKGNGVTRSSYSKEDQMAKEYLIAEMKKLDLFVYEDGFGTLFGRVEGRLEDAPIVMFGSHYDSVVHAGAFDGVAGCVAGLEVMRVLKEEGFQNDYPLELILMNAEEGATFGASTGVSNSRAMVGTLTQHELATAKNRFGQTKLESMAAYGLYPNLATAKRKPGSIKNFIELHIEQGPVLERDGVDIGLVHYLAGIGRFTIRFYGETSDSTASMSGRKDALVVAANFIAEFDKCIKALGPDVTGMVGELHIVPNSNQFIPEFVEGKIEIRTFTKEVVERYNFKEIIGEILGKLEKAFQLKTELVEITRINYPNPTGPSIMNAKGVKKMEDICDALGYSRVILNNGTGHDSMILTEFTDTNMIYVPSKNGVSHCPEEWTDYEAIKKGSDVLLRLVMDVSKK